MNQNRSILRSSEGDCESNTYAIKDSMIQSSSVASYSKKTATKNIGALASCSMELLQALTDLFFGSPPEKRSYLKVLVSLFSLKYFICSHSPLLFEIVEMFLLSFIFFEFQDFLPLELCMFSPFVSVYGEAFADQGCILLYLLFFILYSLFLSALY